MIVMFLMLTWLCILVSICTREIIKRLDKLIELLTEKENE